jgi:hypothetical protein
MRRHVVLSLAAALGLAACTNVSTDPDAVAALQFDGAPYPSVVVGDSLRDSLGLVAPLVAIALNNDGDPIPDAEVVFSSPDTVLQFLEGGIVFGRLRNPTGAASRVYATVGSLQSQPASLFTVQRADSLARGVEADTTNATISEELAFTLLADTTLGAPKVVVPGWLVSFKLRYRGSDLSPNDTSIAYTWTGTTRRIASFVDTTDASGRAGRRVVVRAPRVPEDTVFLVATAKRRKAGTTPLTAETRLIIRLGASASRIP